MTHVWQFEFIFVIQYHTFTDLFYHLKRSFVPNLEKIGPHLSSLTYPSRARFPHIFLIFVPPSELLGHVNEDQFSPNLAQMIFLDDRTNQCMCDIVSQNKLSKDSNCHTGVIQFT